MKEETRPPVIDAAPRNGNSHIIPAQSVRKCDMTFVPGDLSGNPDTADEEFWNDDFVCPACCCGMYIDLPEEKAIKLLKSNKR